jgi:hypothetical protein
VSRIENNRVDENRFRFEDIEKPLERLIREHGGRPAASGPKPEQPFSHLRSSPFWILRTQRQYAPGKTALVSDLRHPDSYAAFRPNVFRLLHSSADARARLGQSAVHAKWSLHVSVRGLNRGTSAPVSSSIAWVLADFFREQVTQASARLSGCVSPPTCRGATWSMWNVAS